MFRRLKIAPKLALFILVGTGTILAAVAYSDYLSAHSILKEELRARAEHLAMATAREMEVIQRAVEKVVLQVRVSLQTEPLSVEQTYRFLENTLQEHKELDGAAVALNSFIEAPGGGSIPFVSRTSAGITTKNLASGDYRYEMFDWYAIPREIARPTWTEPYFDEGGGDRLMVTYSAPILMGPEGRFAGVVTGDLSLEWLTGRLAAMEIGDGGYAFLISRNGIVISHPEKELIMRESIFSVAEAAKNEEARRVGQRMARGETGFVEFLGLRRQEPYWLAYTPVPNTGWSLGAMFPQGQITAKLLALSRTSLFLGCLGAVAMFAVAFIIARSISRPIRELDSATQVLAGGNLDAPLPAPRGGDEVACLTASFARMREDLKKRMEELRVTTEEKARIERDLETARKIQLDILPSRFSFDPPRPEVEIYATLEPAKMVGGDFYDFFLLSGDRLFLAVGDVSGKGVPAALFMAVSKAYLKAFATYGHDTAECLAHLNDELAIENDEGMFLTVFCAEVDLKTGEGCFASGGHNPAFIVRSGGRVEPLPKVRGPLIGLDAGRSFELSRFKLEPGDLLFGYSDGLVEAENAEQALYGEERTMEMLSRLEGQDVRSILTAIREDVRSFVGSAAQSDDITLLGLSFKRP